MEEIFKGMDIVSVLKVGLPGLVFLLSLFSYRLLASEQQNPAPRKVILDSIRKYTYINLTFAVLTLLAPLAELSYGTDTKNKPFTIKVVVAETLSEGNAAVCSGEAYASKYLLIKNDSADRLVQVFSKSIIPCTGEALLFISKKDADDLGWSSAAPGRTAIVVSALPGYKFVI